MKKVALVAPLVLAAAGCGGSASVGGGAAVAPADVKTFVAVGASAPLEQLRAVLPRQAALVARLRRTYTGEIDVAELASGKLVVLMRKKGSWTPTFAAPHLAESETYRSAQAQVDGGARIRGYLAPAAAGHLVNSLPGQLQIVPNPTRRAFPFRTGQPRQLATRHFEWAALELAGNRFSTLVRSTPPTQEESSVARLIQVPLPPYAAHLIDEIPADVISVVDFQVAPSMFENTDPAEFPPQLQRLMQASPQLPFELDQLLGGETAIYRRAGGEVTVVSQPIDMGNAVGTLGQVALELRITAPLYHAFLGGEMIVSTSRRGIAAFLGNGPKLAADPAFRAAAKAAGLPEETNGLIYETSPAQVAWAGHTGALTRFVSVLR
jgi:hypothetical protein